MFEKNATSISQQIEILKSRGLVINDVDYAIHHLSNISYYRLGEYWYAMQDNKENHTFKPNSRFEDVMALYNFDRELRFLLFDVIERIEISLRTKLIYHLSHEFNPWWFQNFDLFDDSKALVKTLAGLEEELERTKEPSIKKHNNKHKDDKRFPPAWKSLEQTSFGTLSKLYGNLKNTIESKDIIAKDFGAVNHTYLPSWLQSITQIRNFCAHHSRLWNKNLPSTLKLLTKPPFKWIVDVPNQNDYKYLYIHLCIMKYLLNIIEPENQFTQRLKTIFEKYPNVDPNALGMKPNWELEPLWK